MRGWILALLSLVALGAQTVEESFSRDPGPLDFVRGEGHEQAILQSLTGDALVGLDLQGKPIPRLASRWEILPGGIRFHLRPALFSDGTPVRAEDVLWTLREIQGHEDASPTKRGILQGVRVSGQGHVVELASLKPAERLLRELGRVPIARAGSPSLGSGPYRVERRGSEWFFQARDHFLAPGIKNFHFRLVPDPQGVLQGLRKGWLSIGVPPPRMGLSPPLTHRELIQPTHAQLVVWSRAGGQDLLRLEKWRGEAFPAALLGSTARPSRGLWPESLGFPVRRLKGELQPAPGLKMELLYSAGDEFVTRLLLALAARAKRDGITLDLIPVEAGLLYQRLQKGEFQLACALVLFDPHPWSVLEYVEPSGPMNFTGWGHADLPGLLNALKAPGSPAWAHLQELWAASARALPVLDFQSVVWVDRRLQVQSSPLGLYMTTPGPAGWSWAK
jgi:ABC-type transport system substrate-binding protein